MHGFDSQETRIHVRVLAVGVEDIRSNDCGKVVEIHLTAGLFVDRMEGCCPAYEREQDFHRVAVDLWQ